MITAIDSNVLIALLSNEPLAVAIADSLQNFQSDGALVISAPVFAELHAHPRATPQFIDNFVTEIGINVDFEMSSEVWRLTADRYSAYCTRRRHSRGGQAKRLLADFIIAAHASIKADRFFSLDKERYKAAFPTLKIVTL